MNQETSQSRFRVPLFLGPLVALILVVVLFAVLDGLYSQGRFFTADNLSNISIQTCVYALAAVGMTVVIISGGIDLSCGTAVTLSATVVAFCIYHDVGSQLANGSNVRDAAVRVAQLIEKRDDTPRLAEAKERLRAVIGIKQQRLETQWGQVQAAMKDRGWLELSAEQEETLQSEEPGKYDDYERMEKDYKRLRENVETQARRVEELRSDDFYLSVEAAKQDWGNKLPNHPLTVYLAILGGVGTGLLCGLANGMAIAFLKIVPFVVTLGTMTIFLGIGNLISGNVPIRTVRGDMVPSWLYQSLSLNSEFLFLGLPPGIWALVAAALLVGLVLRSTVFGRYSFALGSNEATARLCGINVSWQKLLIYALSGALIGLAGVFQFSRLTVGDPESGLGLELKVIAAVVIGGGSLTGGRGSIAGTLCGAVMLAVILNGCTQLGLPVSIEKIVVGAIIIFAVFLDQPAPKQWMRNLFERRKTGKAA
ncbi:MAG: ABC transporter permease [Planctomycetota bacterium]|nr:ABC transporter permease [Planctomycetota bacterium]